MSEMRPFTANSIYYPEVYTFRVTEDESGNIGISVRSDEHVRSMTISRTDAVSLAEHLRFGLGIPPSGAASDPVHDAKYRQRLDAVTDALKAVQATGYVAVTDDVTRLAAFLLTGKAPDTP